MVVIKVKRTHSCRDLRELSRRWSDDHCSR